MVKVFTEKGLITISRESTKRVDRGHYFAVADTASCAVWAGNSAPCIKATPFSPARHSSFAKEAERSILLAKEKFLYVAVSLTF